MILKTIISKMTCQVKPYVTSPVRSLCVCNLKDIECLICPIDHKSRKYLSALMNCYWIQKAI